jgi:chromate transporter
MSKRSHDPSTTSPSEITPDTNGVDPATAGVGQDVILFGAAVRAWFAISLQTFGGPAGQIAVVQRALVDDHRWIGRRRFLHALSYDMLVPCALLAGRGGF